MKALFLCKAYQKPEAAHYQHGLVVLAEGMQEEGLTFFGNIDYWQTEKGFLIQKAPFGYTPDVVICQQSYSLDTSADMSLLAGSVLIDLADGYHSQATDSANVIFHRILRSHYNDDLPYLPNVRPWFFGLSNRIIKGIDEGKKGPFPESKTILHNYRVAHEIRDFALAMLNKQFTKANSKTELIQRFSEGQTGDQLQGDSLLNWAQSGRRHDPAFYSYLSEYAFTLAFGGFMWERPRVINLPKVAKHIAKLFYLKALNTPSQYYTLYNWDSWRFWEVLYSASIPIHFNLDAWGCRLPVMPEAGIHYLGVKEYDFKDTIERIDNLTMDDMGAISAAGTVFALKHYSPQASLSHFKQAIL
jgi:hypothetical protein